MKVIRKNVTNSTQKTILYTLLKFGNEEHLIELLKNGKLYLSSIQDIRKEEKKQNEEKNFRNDPVEGANKYRSIGPGTALATLPNGDSFPLSFQNLMYYEKSEFVLGNICSFYGIATNSFSDNELIPIDEQMNAFGSHFIFIKNFTEFIHRVDKALEKLEISWYYGFVEYFDENQYVGEMHLFKKRSRYSFQNEFRIYLETDNTTPLKLSIGNLEDIADIRQSNKIGELKMALSDNANILYIRESNI